MVTKWWNEFSRLMRLTEADKVAPRLREMMDAGFRLDDDIGEIDEAIPPMFWAIIGGKGGGLVLAEMLRLGANPNVQRKDTGGTPLMFAPIIGDTDYLQMLLEAGADTEIHDNEGRTALHEAAANLNPKAVSLLLRHGANRFHRDHANLSVSDKARASGIAFAKERPLSLDWSPSHQAARDAAIAAKVAEIIALLEDTKTAE